MNENNSCLVSVDKRGELIPVDWYQLAEGHIWSYPLLFSARSCLRRVFNYLSDEQGCDDIGYKVKASRESVIPKFSLNTIAEKMVRRCEKLIANHLGAK